MVRRTRGRHDRKLAERDRCQHEQEYADLEKELHRLWRTRSRVAQVTPQGDDIAAGGRDPLAGSTSGKPDHRYPLDDSRGKALRRRRRRDAQQHDHHSNHQSTE